ncbi:hypothetical protein D3C85_1432040 [compost metagenome]
MTSGSDSGPQLGLWLKAELVTDVFQHRIALANDPGIEHQHRGAVEHLAEHIMVRVCLAGARRRQQRHLLRDGEQADRHRRAYKREIHRQLKILVALQLGDDDMLGKQTALPVDERAIDQVPELLLRIGGIEQGLHRHDGGRDPAAQLVIGREREMLSQPGRRPE